MASVLTSSCHIYRCSFKFEKSTIKIGLNLRELQESVSTRYHIRRFVQSHRVVYFERCKSIIEFLIKIHQIV